MPQSLALHGSHAGAWGLPSLTLMWFAMMAAMMAPAVWPWVAAFRRFDGDANRPISRRLSTLTFVGGYLAAWLVYAVIAAMLQSGWALATTDAAARIVGALILVAAGLFQFAPLKRACLQHCRSPVSYFLSRWRNGPSGGFRLGFGHGIFCVGCCWALMATSFAVGMTNLWWMAVLTLAAFVEQVVPRGDRLRVPLGVALVGAGIVRFSMS
jgi:predicted metal-binding membrane protein